jgi:peptide/nickel transport system permease protein
MSIERKKADAIIKGFKKRKPATLQWNFLFPVIILSLLILTAIFAPLLAPYLPNDTALTEQLRPPVWLKGGSSAHILGTNNLGQDILSRLIYGSRVSLSVSLLVILITASVGTLIGIISGYSGGRVDAVLMRITDISLSFPSILIALLLAVILGPSFSTVVLALSIFGWAGYARLIRGESLRLRQADFVSQARITGSSSIRIMTKHIFPNVINPLIVISTLQIGMVILAESALSYLGAGIPANDASWGSMVSDGRNIIDLAWWVSFFPGLAIGLVVLSGNFLGDWLRDKLDPRLRQL